MISVSFAPNETLKDGILGFSLLFTPWNWRNKELSADLELEISKLLEVKRENISFFLTGRSAILNVLKALNLKEGDRVLVQTFTCEAVILPILALKLVPIYVDIEKETFSMDLDSFKKRLNKNVKAVVLQHSFAIEPKYRKEIIELASKSGVFVIEDLAHGFTKEILREDSIKILSFGRSKSFSSVWGGAVVCNDRNLSSKVENLSNELKNPSFMFIFQALIHKPISVIIKSTYDLLIGKIIHKLLSNYLTKEITPIEKQIKFDQSLNVKYSAAFAKMLWLQLADYEIIQNQRKKITDFYSKELSLNYKGALLRYPVLVENPPLLLKKFASKNIFLGNWYNDVIAPENLNLPRLAYREGSCPNAEEITKKIVNLPTLISLAQAQTIVTLLK